LTAYELADYTGSIMGNFLTALTVYFSVTTAYVVAAFVAGNRLNRIQLAIVNLTFTIAAGVIGFLVIAIFARFYSFATPQANPEGSFATVDFTLPLGILVTVMFVGSITFMWSIRKSPNDA
jgi:hypothetical protein